jgi:hypothetical protein
MATTVSYTVIFDQLLVARDGKKALTPRVSGSYQPTTLKSPQSQKQFDIDAVVYFFVTNPTR